MVDGASVELRPDPRITGEDPVFAHIDETQGRQVPIGIGVRVCKIVLLVTVSEAAGGPDRYSIGDIVFTAGHEEKLLFFGKGEVLRIIRIGIRRIWNGRRWRDLGSRPVNRIVLISGIGGEAQTFAIIINAERQAREIPILIIDGRFAEPPNGHPADAPLIIGAEPLPEIGGAEKGPVALISQRHPPDSFIGRTFGHEIYRSTDRTVPRRGAIDERIDATEHLDPLHERSCHELPRHYPVEAVECQVVRKDREAADLVDILKVSEPLLDAHRRIVDEHVTHAIGLLILGELRGVSRTAERKVAVLDVPQKTGASTGCHLSARRNIDKLDL